MYIPTSVVDWQMESNFRRHFIQLVVEVARLANHHLRVLLLLSLHGHLRRTKLPKRRHVVGAVVRGGGHHLVGEAKLLVNVGDDLGQEVTCLLLLKIKKLFTDTV